ncbi:hypothetical protein J7481_19625 [Labrenzia sp. R4_2]|uniref:hypothetical protein n=1 Tax=Labrenzia sp. R4_2 TaxID=2821107 RepID=UPI001ADB78B3|nr:hypothetical protein [Labrenzia sp. R4_2]MBO9421727.1 hypothetical protein [Labrenzia sp. R4_2]
MTWPTRGPDFNRWNVDFGEFAKILEENRDLAFWPMDTGLKYLNIRIDTRDNAFLISNDDGKKISPDRVLVAIEKYKKEFGCALKRGRR